MARFRPVSKFARYAHQALCDYSKGITLALTGNLTFPTPPVTLADQGTANDSMQAAILAWGPAGNRGSRVQHVSLLDARKVVEENIRNLNGYVNGIAAGDQGMIFSAGMVASEVRNPIGPLPAPQNLRSVPSKTLVSGQVQIAFDPVKGARAYVIFTAAVLTDPWLYLGVTTKASYLTTSTPGRLNYYMVKAVGSAGLGVASDPLEAHAAF